MIVPAVQQSLGRPIFAVFRDALVPHVPCPAHRAAYLYLMEDTRVLYNDSCPVCSFEIDAYRRRAVQDGLPLQFDTLDQAARWGIPPDQAARRLHVLHKGQVLSGVPAFRALWGGNATFAMASAVDRASVHRGGGGYALRSDFGPGSILDAPAPPKARLTKPAT